MTQNQLSNNSNRPEVKVVARYGSDYEITKGITNDMHYGFYKDKFLGHNQQLSYMISLISIQEGQNFDINKVKIL